VGFKPLMIDPDVRRLVGSNFERLRREKGLTQEQVEERSGFSQWYTSSLEAGRRNPTIISLRELAEAIGVQVADLIDESTWDNAEASPSIRGRKAKKAAGKEGV
jgi:transcriptional regulator with XRE-family HTH domain